MNSRLPLLVACALPVLFIIAAYSPTTHFLQNQYDDAYITYRYAINLAEGNGLVFNLTERTDAASSFLYTSILSASWSLGTKNLELVSGLIGLLFLSVLCGLVYKLAFFLSENKIAALVVSVSSGVNGLMSGWALSGMETIFFSTLILFYLYLAITDSSRKLSYIVLLLAALTRLEGIFLLGPAILFLILRKENLSAYVPYISTAFTVALFYIIKHNYYGVWISHAYEMKGISEYYQPNPIATIKIWLYYLSLPVLFWLPNCLRKEHSPITLYCIISMVLVLLGPYSDWTRYSVHIIPITYAFSSIFMAKLFSLKRWNMVTIVPLVFLAQATYGALFNWTNMTTLATHQECRRELAAYINENIPSNEKIVSSDLGAIAYFAHKYSFIDLIALTSSDVLDNYKNKQNADDILRNMDAKFLADTFHPETQNRIQNVLDQFPLVHTKSKFKANNDDSLFSCSTRDGLVFSVVEII